MTPRVVLDTNVVVSALRSRRGASARLLTLVGTSRFEYCLSVALFLEYESALKRLETGVELPHEAIDDVLDYLASEATRQEIFYLWRPVLTDPADDHVLEVAVAGGCESVVTYNLKDFTAAAKFGIRALTPLDFLAQLESQP